MSLKNLIKKEWYVVKNGQTARFRVLKYIVILLIAAGLYWWGGWIMLAKVFAAAVIAAIVIHFFFRYMTDGWRKPWGSYKPLPFEDD